MRNASLATKPATSQIQASCRDPAITCEKYPKPRSQDLQWPKCSQIILRYAPLHELCHHPLMAFNCACPCVQLIASLVLQVLCEASAPLHLLTCMCRMCLSLLPSGLVTLSCFCGSHAFLRAFEPFRLPPSHPFGTSAKDAEREAVCRDLIRLGFEGLLYYIEARKL